MKLVEFQYKGHYYVPWEDREDDNIKVFHDVECADGELRWLPLSPYDKPTMAYFEMWVDAGCPTHPSRLSFEELKEMMLAKAAEEIFLGEIL